MSQVTHKLKAFTAEHPSGEKSDPWVDFREIEVIGLNWAQSYKHSLGKYSRFFLELEKGHFLATQCPACQKTWTPPRPACPECLRPTRWIELSGYGRLTSWSVLHHAPKMLAERLEPPYVLAYVKMEGADTLFAHLLRGVAPDQLRHGMPVQVVYNAGPVDHPIMLMAFEPVAIE